MSSLFVISLSFIHSCHKRNILKRVHSFKRGIASNSFSGKSVTQIFQDSGATYLSTESLLSFLLEKTKGSSNLSQASNLTDESNSMSYEKRHNIGKLLVDLGYKRVYQSSVQTLATTPVWERQRTLRPQRSLLIAEEKLRTSTDKKVNITGIISAYLHKQSGDIGILDGQHRYPISPFSSSSS